jgi:glucose dehydrogenase
MTMLRAVGLRVVPIRSVAIRLAACCLALAAASAQVSYERLLNAGDEPGQWLTYSGAYDGHRFSSLDEIHRGNVDQLELKWVFQTKSLEKFEVTPLVADGVMYFTQAPNTAIAIDPSTGREFWRYEHQGAEAPVCCGRVNRGLAILGETLYMGTIDGKLVALDAASGNVRWQVQAADPRQGYALTVAPLVIKD